MPAYFEINFQYKRSDITENTVGGVFLGSDRVRRCVQERVLAL